MKDVTEVLNAEKSVVGFKGILYERGTARDSWVKIEMTSGVKTDSNGNTVSDEIWESKNYSKAVNELEKE